MRNILFKKSILNIFIMLTSLKKSQHLLNNLSETSEFEIMFNNYNPKNKLSIIKFIRMLSFIKYKSTHNFGKLSYNTSLDVLYSQSKTDSYRITINGIDNINKILNMMHQRKSNIIFSVLISEFQSTDYITIINKQKSPDNIIDFDEYDIRIRVSDEIPLDKKTISKLSDLQHTEKDKIFFRYKQRISLIEETSDYKLSTDLTVVQLNSDPNKLYDSDKIFEVELEYTPISKTTDKIFDKILTETQYIKQVLENVQYVLSKTEIDNILKIYKKTIYGYDRDTSVILYSMQPISTEVQHVVDKIPNKYAVTDKADGEKVQLIVIDNIIYILTNNLEIRQTKYKSDLNNTILEGELMYINNIYILLCYDCLFFDNKDIRSEHIFKKRYQYVLEFIKSITPTAYIINDYNDKFNIENQELHYKQEIEKFYKVLNKLISSSKPNDIVFHHKIMLFPSGGNSCEVYSYSYLIWKICTGTSNIKCPYLLDGIIYTGLEQKYTRDKKDQKYPIYKYKPPATNSIDVYIKFERNVDTGGYLEFYDNSLSVFGLNKTFRIVNFYVGEVVSNKEIPVPFMKEENNHEAYFMLENNEVRDIEGKLVNDNTVVEVIYCIDYPSIPHQYRWKILRTRWDKTESVLRDKCRYGNYKDIAIKVWKSMKEAVTIDEIKNLSNPSTYNQQMKLLSSRIDTTVISTERAQDIYYQKITELGKKFRNFSNWIKSILLYPYCEPYYNKKKDVLDIGCGRGGDILRMYHSRVREYVGLDPDHEGLFGAIDSAMVRYQSNCNKYPDFPKMKFIQADASVPLTSEAQSKKLFNITDYNKKLLDTTFTSTKKFDIISFQFSIHYLFDNTDSVDNIVNIISQYLNKDGYIICTTLDPKQLMILLNGKDTYTSWYTDDDGKRKKFFEIIKKFSGPLKDVVGQNIDIFMAWIHQENNFKTEYLITPNMLINTMKRASCSFIESDLFANIYTINKEWFMNVIDYEENPKNKKFYKNVAEFYDDLKDVDKEGKIWNDLFRYYIFKKN